MRELQRMSSALPRVSGNETWMSRDQRLLDFVPKTCEIYDLVGI